MHKIWTLVNQLKIAKAKKVRLFLCLMTCISGLAGSFIWLIIARSWLKSLAWLLCFIAYPAIFVGIIGGMIYLYKHEFN